MCPVNYSCSKLSGNEVPGSSPGPSSRLCPLLLSSPFSFSLSFPLFFSFAKHCPPPLSVEHPPVERERTNKSARALRRDIVSCKVNHLRGSKTAASPCRDLLSPPREASRRRLLPPQCRFARYSAAQASPLLPLSLIFFLPSALRVRSSSSSRSVQLASICGHIASSLASSDP